jgi:uncharacterized spore protein YtfJ
MSHLGTELSSSLEVLFGKMENFISTKTVIGEPIHIGGVIIVPLVDVTFGVGAGVSDGSMGKDEKNGEHSAGGGALGGKIAPAAVLVVNEGTVQLVSVKNEDSVKKLIDLVPGIISKLNLGAFFTKKKDGERKVEFEETKVTPPDTPDEFFE